MEWIPAGIRALREQGLCLPQDRFATTLGFTKRTVGNAERALSARSEPQTGDFFSFDAPYLPYYAGTACVWLGKAADARSRASQAVELCDADPMHWPVARTSARVDLAVSLAHADECDGATIVRAEADEIWTRVAERTPAVDRAVCGRAERTPAGGLSLTHVPPTTDFSWRRPTSGTYRLAQVEFRHLSEGRRVTKPSLDEDELEPGPSSFSGEIDLDLVRVAGGDCAGSRGHGAVTRSTVSDVDLTGATLSPLTVSDTRFTGVDLSNASIQQANLRRAEWLRLRAIGLRMAIDRLEDGYFEGVRFDYATVHIERVKGLAVFQQCSFREAEIRGDLSGVVFDQCELAGARFTARAANGTDLTTSRLDGALGLLSLRGARITMTQALSIAVQLAAEAGLSVEH